MISHGRTELDIDGETWIAEYKQERKSDRAAALEVRFQRADGSGRHTMVRLTTVTPDAGMRIDRLRELFREALPE